jgi:hypothetical protein
LTSAKGLWNDREKDDINSDELPLLRSGSNIAWGIWNQATARTTSLQNIHLLMSCDIVNPQTREIMKRALKAQKEMQPSGETRR